MTSSFVSWAVTLLEMWLIQKQSVDLRKAAERRRTLGSRKP